jgi:hypothetical protein
LQAYDRAAAGSFGNDAVTAADEVYRKLRAGDTVAHRLFVAGRDERKLGGGEDVVATILQLAFDLISLAAKVPGCLREIHRPLRAGEDRARRWRIGARIDNRQNLFDVPREVVEFAPVSLIAMPTQLLPEGDGPLRRLVYFVELVAQLLLKFWWMLRAVDVGLNDFYNTQPITHEQAAIFFRETAKLTQFTQTPFGLEVTGRENGDQDCRVLNSFLEHVSEVSVARQPGIAPYQRLITQRLAQDTFETFVEVIDPTLPLFIEKFVVQMAVADKDIICEGRRHFGGSKNYRENVPERNTIN